MDIEADKREAVVFASSLVQQVNREDVNNIVQAQRAMLQRFEKTNEMLINFNQLSFARYEASVKDFQQHTQLLFDMRKDLDSIFKRIRVLKQRLGKSYPEAFAACSSVIMAEEEEEGKEESATQPSGAACSAASQRSSSDSRKPAHADVNTSKTNISQPRRRSASQSKGGNTAQPVGKNSKSRMENKETGDLKSTKPRSSSLSSRSQAKAASLAQ